MWIGYALEGLLAVLLIITIAYCIVLDRRLKAMRSGKDGLKEVILGLNDSTLRAQQGIAQLRSAGEQAGRELADRIREGRSLADELSLMIESGNNLADRLESLCEPAADQVKRQVAASVPQPTQTPRSAPARAGGTRAPEPAGHPSASQSGETGAEILKALQRAR